MGGPLDAPGGCRDVGWGGAADRVDRRDQQDRRRRQRRNPAQRQRTGLLGDRLGHPRGRRLRPPGRPPRPPLPSRAGAQRSGPGTADRPHRRRAAVPRRLRGFERAGDERRGLGVRRGRSEVDPDGEGSRLRMPRPAQGKGGQGLRLRIRRQRRQRPQPLREHQGRRRRSHQRAQRSGAAGARHRLRARRPPGARGGPRLHLPLRDADRAAQQVLGLAWHGPRGRRAPPPRPVHADLLHLPGPAAPRLGPRRTPARVGKWRSDPLAHPGGESRGRSLTAASGRRWRKA